MTKCQKIVLAKEKKKSKWLFQFPMMLETFTYGKTAPFPRGFPATLRVAVMLYSHPDHYVIIQNVHFTLGNPSKGNGSAFGDTVGVGDSYGARSAQPQSADSRAYTLCGLFLRQTQAQDQT